VGLEQYADSQPQQTNESFGDKALRELQLLGVGFGAVPTAARDAFSERPVQTSLMLVTAAGLSAALGYATSKAGPLRGIAQSVGVGLGVSMVGDFGRNLSPALGALADNWNSGANWDQNKAIMEQRFAPFVFDTTLAMGGGMAGGFAGSRFARSQQFEPMLPAFTKDGFLPPGIHKATWQEFATTYGTTPRRQDLLANMEFLLREAKSVGGEKVYVGGSFVTTKANPKDFDMTWKIDGQRIGEIRQTNPIVVDRTMQSEKLGGELMVTYPGPGDGGVLAFLMKNNRYRTQVGVVELDLATLPSNTSYKLRSWLGTAGPRPIPDIAKTEPLTPMPKNSPYGG
jgi:hypothetical protein